MQPKELNLSLKHLIKILTGAANRIPDLNDQRFQVALAALKAIQLQYPSISPSSLATLAIITAIAFPKLMTDNPLKIWLQNFKFDDKPALLYYNEEMIQQLTTSAINPKLNLRDHSQW